MHLVNYPSEQALDYERDTIHIQPSLNQFLEIEWWVHFLNRCLHLHHHSQKKNIWKTKCHKSFSAKGCLIVVSIHLPSWLGTSFNEKMSYLVWNRQVQQTTQKHILFNNCSISCTKTQNINEINFLQFWFNIYVKKTLTNMSDKVCTDIAIILSNIKFHAKKFFHFN